MAKTFTIVYWNTWFDLQDGNRDSGMLVCQRLQQFVDAYDPDVFGLNEVYVDKAGNSPIIEWCKQKGYYIHFAPQILGDKGQLIGNMLVSKLPPSSVKTHPYGDGVKAPISWFKDHTPNLIAGTLQAHGLDITVIVTHPIVLLPSTLRTHIRHRRSHDNIIKTFHDKNLIIGGDFNELKYMPPWLHLPKRFKRLTGSMFNPTWILNRNHGHLLRGNLDNIMYSTDGNLQLDCFKILKRYPSDHAPLVARFKLT